MDKVNEIALKHIVPAVVDEIFKISPFFHVINAYSTMSSMEIGIAKFVEQEHGLDGVLLQRLSHGHVGREWSYMNSMGHRIEIKPESGPGLTIRQATTEGTEPNKMAKLLAP